MLQHRFLLNFLLPGISTAGVHVVSRSRDDSLEGMSCPCCCCCNFWHERMIDDARRFLRGNLRLSNGCTPYFCERRNTQQGMVFPFVDRMAVIDT